jgi:aspartyl-tRNA(Asn)/glutamyl-tRNA(Gln) amidotransferase subunit C
MVRSARVGILGKIVMSVDKSTVARIAHLARIAVPEEHLEPLAAELNQILAFVEQLNEVDTGNIAPMASVADMKLRRREDEITDGGYAEDVLKNAPAAEHGFFAVPKVIE